ncbi:MAG: BolA/IbaG family iron-sulfur metabolism protein [Fidelibacterota bacterium]|nr:MAG: BolA/IbaG family iron-sulfur metabolism protein [Candidatus Neomarinimicrobiota bacterium]
MTAMEVQTLIEEHLTDAHVQVSDTRGNGSHFKAVVISPHFRGKSLVEQHRMVYKACNDYLKREIHALQIETHTPDAWSERS